MGKNGLKNFSNPQFGEIMTIADHTGDGLTIAKVETEVTMRGQEYLINDSLNTRSHKS